MGGEGVSAIGLPTDGHAEPHFDAISGLCQCPCSECTSRPAWFCFCLDCPCETMADHHNDGGGT